MKILTGSVTHQIIALRKNITRHNNNNNKKTSTRKKTRKKSKQELNIIQIQSTIHISNVTKSIQDRLYGTYNKTKKKKLDIYKQRKHVNDNDKESVFRSHPQYKNR